MVDFISINQFFCDGCMVSGTFGTGEGREKGEGIRRGKKGRNQERDRERESKEKKEKPSKAGSEKKRIDRLRMGSTWTVSTMYCQ